MKIEGKEYIEVHKKINYFNDNYPNGMIQTDIKYNSMANLQDGTIIVAVTRVYPNSKNLDRFFTGHSTMKLGTEYFKGSAFEIAETSAVGRALSMMGIGVIDSVASVDEINKGKLQNKGNSNTQTAKVDAPESKPETPETNEKHEETKKTWATAISDAKTKDDLYSVGNMIKGVRLPKAIKAELQELWKLKLKEIITPKKD